MSSWLCICSPPQQIALVPRDRLAQERVCPEPFESVVVRRPIFIMSYGNVAAERAPVGIGARWNAPAIALVDQFPGYSHEALFARQSSIVLMVSVSLVLEHSLSV